jgi:hypothetical protein
MRSARPASHQSEILDLAVERVHLPVLQAAVNDDTVELGDTL